MTGRKPWRTWDEIEAEAKADGRIDEGQVAAERERTRAEQRAYRLAEIRKQKGLSQAHVTAAMHVSQRRGVGHGAGRVVSVLVPDGDPGVLVFLPARDGELLQDSAGPGTVLPHPPGVCAGTAPAEPGVAECGHRTGGRASAARFGVGQSPPGTRPCGGSSGNGNAARPAGRAPVRLPPPAVRATARARCAAAPKTTLPMALPPWKTTR
jgi:hypothetical protein